MHHAIFALPEALVQEAQAVAQAEQTSLDAFVWTAMRGKIAAARTAQSFRTRAARANPQAFLVVLERMTRAAGAVGAGDELEPGRGAGPPLPLRAGGSRVLAASPIRPPRCAGQARAASGGQVCCCDGAAKLEDPRRGRHHARQGGSVITGDAVPLLW
jgi:hypothetical protein